MLAGALLGEQHRPGRFEPDRERAQQADGQDDRQRQHAQADVQRPLRHGVEARRPDLAGRFLFITGNMDDPEPWRFLAKIRAHVLEKPFTGRALRHALIKVVA